jgi:hypothetical protein
MSVIIFDKWKIDRKDNLNIVLSEKSITEKDGEVKVAWTFRGYFRDLDTVIYRISKEYINESCEESKTLTDMLIFLDNKEKSINNIIAEKIEA